MENLTKIDKDLLAEIADLHETPIGAYNIRKYCAAVLEIASSTRIHTGTIGLSDTVRIVKKIPRTSVARVACADARFALSTSPAPTACEI